MFRPVHRIYKQDVLPTVAVIIDDADAATHGFRQILFPEAAVVMSKVNTRGLRNIHKSNRTCRASHSWWSGRGMQNGFGRRRSWLRDMLRLGGAWHCLPATHRRHEH